MVAFSMRKFSERFVGAEKFSPKNMIIFLSLVNLEILYFLAKNRFLSDRIGGAHALGNDESDKILSTD